MKLFEGQTMADHGDTYHKGEMDISDHVQTWHWFTKATFWGCVGGACLAVFLFIFRT
jgi:hypothetical protein